MRFVNIECRPGGRSSGMLELHVSFLEALGVPMTLSRICEEDNREYFTVVFENDFPVIDSYFIVDEGFYHGNDMKNYDFFVKSPKSCGRCRIKRNVLCLLADEKGPISIVCTECLNDVDLAHRFLFGTGLKRYDDICRQVSWRRFRNEQPFDGKVFFDRLIRRCIDGKRVYLIPSPGSPSSGMFDEFHEWVTKNMERDYLCWFANYTIEHDCIVPVHHDMFFELSYAVCEKFLEHRVP